MSSAGFSSACSIRRCRSLSASSGRFLTADSIAALIPSCSATQASSAARLRLMSSESASARLVRRRLTLAALGDDEEIQRQRPGEPFIARHVCQILEPPTTPRPTRRTPREPVAAAILAHGRADFARAVHREDRVRTPLPFGPAVVAPATLSQVSQLSLSQCCSLEPARPTRLVHSRLRVPRVGADR